MIDLVHLGSAFIPCCRRLFVECSRNGVVIKVIGVSPFCFLKMERGEGSRPRGAPLAGRGRSSRSDCV